MYRTRIDVSANRNGEVGGKCEWKMAGGERLTQFWIQNVISPPPPHDLLCPRGSRYALAAWASPSRLALRARGSGLALAARATRSWLGLRPPGSRYCGTRRNGRTTEPQNGSTQNCRMAETAEWQNGRVAERQNGRTAERQNGRTPERRNGITAVSSTILCILMSNTKSYGSALMACTTRSRLGLRPSWHVLCACGLRFALAERATRLRLAICARGLGFASRLMIHPRGTRYALAACLWLALWPSPSRVALCACRSGAVYTMRFPLGLHPRGSRLIFDSSLILTLRGLDSDMERI
jgi:hypothetical protein